MKRIKWWVWPLLIVIYFVGSYYSLLMDRYWLEEVAFDGKYKILWIFLLAAVAFGFMFFMVKIFDLVKYIMDRNKERSEDNVH